MTSRSLHLAAWALLLAVAVVTVVPIGLRPMIGPPQIERFATYGLVGFVFALAYPRHLLRIMLVIVMVVVGLELAQLLVASRHARPQDVAVKLAGSGAGIVAGLAFERLRRRLSGSRAG